MANESGADENLCFFITRIGEEGSPERDQAEGVMDAIAKPTAKEVGMECVRADQLPDPGQITTQIIDRLVGAKYLRQYRGTRRPLAQPSVEDRDAPELS